MLYNTAPLNTSQLIGQNPQVCRHAGDATVRISAFILFPPLGEMFTRLIVIARCVHLLTTGQPGRRGKTDSSSSSRSFLLKLQSSQHCHRISPSGLNDRGDHGQILVPPCRPVSLQGGRNRPPASCVFLS